MAQNYCNQARERRGEEDRGRNGNEEQRRIEKENRRSQKKIRNLKRHKRL